MTNKVRIIFGALLAVSCLTPIYSQGGGETWWVNKTKGGVYQPPMRPLWKLSELKAKYAGKNKVNPMAMMLSGVLMLRHLDEGEAANRLEGAIADVIREGRSVTYDMKPTRDDPTAVGTSDVADAIVDALGARVS